MLHPDGSSKTFFEYHLVMPPVHQFTREAATHLFQTLERSYGLQSLQFSDAGALLTGPNLALNVQVAQSLTIQYNFSQQVIPKELLIPQVKEIVGLSKSAFRIPLLIVPQVKLQALWACVDESSYAFLARKTSMGEHLDLSRLGSNVAIGLRLISNQENRVFDIRIEPFFPNPSHLYVEVAGTFPGVLIQDNLDALDETIESTYATLDTLEGTIL